MLFANIDVFCPLPLTHLATKVRDIYHSLCRNKVRERILWASMMVVVPTPTPAHNNNKNAPRHTVQHNLATILPSPLQYMTRLMSLP